MKSFPIRNWSIEFFGVGSEYHSCSFCGTSEEAFAKANEEECEFDWEAVRILIVALG